MQNSPYFCPISNKCRFFWNIFITFQYKTSCQTVRPVWHVLIHANRRRDLKEIGYFFETPACIKFYCNRRDNFKKGGFLYFGGVWKIWVLSSGIFCRFPLGVWKYLYLPMACNFAPNDDIAYISYRQFNDLWEDIYQQQVKLISSFALTTLATGSKAVDGNNQIWTDSFCTHGNFT